MFPCTNCGLCCQNISQIKELEDFNLGNGVCKFFNLETNSCNIYNIRPNICRVDTMFDLKYNKLFSREEFYKLNIAVCNKLQDTYNFDMSYRINLGE